MDKDRFFLRILSVVLILFYWNVQAYSQSVQVAQRKVSKSLSAEGLQKIVIGTEKADMTIQAWGRSEVLVEVELSARHTDKSVAVRDLEKVQLVLNKERKTFFIRDFILLKGKDSKPEANLKANYVIYAPANLALDIQGAFGVVDLKGFTNQVNLRANFCDIRMEQLSGVAELNTSFGKLDARQLTGRLELSANHTQLILRKIGGDVKLNTSFGSLQVEPSAQLSSLHLKLKKTIVDLVCPEWKKYSYAIQGAYTKFRLPEGFKGDAAQQENQQLSFGVRGRPPVVVQAEFGDFTIR